MESLFSSMYIKPGQKWRVDRRRRIIMPAEFPSPAKTAELTRTILLPRTVGTAALVYCARLCMPTHSVFIPENETYDEERTALRQELTALVRLHLGKLHLTSI